MNYEHIFEQTLDLIIEGMVSKVFMNTQSQIDDKIFNLIDQQKLLVLVRDRITSNWNGFRKNIENQIADGIQRLARDTAIINKQYDITKLLIEASENPDWRDAEQNKILASGVRKLAADLKDFIDASKVA